ncbi:hypothetical protein DL768_003426 [Monosporascus sp. mg162]|nr:hypothetical protein DL768_003426 [Monosporascus sp. mg162]
MRPINNESMELEEFMGGAHIPDYAILSHTWEDGEVTFQDFTHPNKVMRSEKRGYRKIEKACCLARKTKLKYVWVDTCCIDKTSSAELTEAINSMFQCLFAWKATSMDQMYRGVFASTPAEFRDSGFITLVSDTAFNPDFILTSKGLRLTHSLHPGRDGTYLLDLNCSQPTGSRRRHIGIWIKPHGGGVYGRAKADEFVGEWDPQRRMFLTHGASNFAGLGFFGQRSDITIGKEFMGGESFLVVFGKNATDEEPWVTIASPRDGGELFQHMRDP